MLYLLKFIKLWLLPPGIFVLLLAALAFSLRRGGKIKYAAAVLTAAFCISALPVTAGLLLRPLEAAFAPAAGRVDVIAVLGGGAVQGTPADVGSGSLLGSGANRLLAGAQLQKRTGLPIIITGGQVYAGSGNEAEISRRILLNLGIPAEKIIVENKARNTAENAAYTAQICRRHGWGRVYLVTSAFHMPRSMELFGRQQGLELLPQPCDYQLSAGGGVSLFSFLPQADAAGLAYLALHEYLALLALHFM